MKKQRPVNLDLTTFSFPPSAISSILHRITGVAMFFALIAVIALWAISLSSKEGFELAVAFSNSAFGNIIEIGTVSALLYHVLGGVRHMIMDTGRWEEIKSGNLSASIIIGLWVVLTILVGIVLW